MTKNYEERYNMELSPNREFKARIFEMVYSDRERLLELYNAANGTDYKEPNLLEINTLKNAIYMAMHNDVSFIIDSRLSLYEHQSTYSPNFPLRCLMYVSDLYSVITKDENLYGRRLVKIPTPHFLVFYNGEEELPDRLEMRLSDAFTVKEEEAFLELKLTVLNINPGHNEKLKEACKTLKDYTEYTHRVRTYAKRMSIEDAVERAITECIREGILADFLSEHRSEAWKMSIYEYDQEKHMKQEREENWKAGHEAGIREGHEVGAKAQLLEGVNKMLSKGMAISDVAVILDKREMEIENLLQEEG